MANPVFLSNIKFPITEKPTVEYTAQNLKIYTDIFNIQNAIRLIITNFTEEAPLDGKQYARKDGTWVEVTSSGGGGIPEAPVDGKLYGRKNASWEVVPSGGSSIIANLILTGNPTATDNNYRGYTIFCLLAASVLIGTATKWKFSMWFQAGGPFTLGAIKLLKTPIGGNTVLDSTTLTIGGIASPTITPPNGSLFRVTVDDINIPLDATYDFYVAVYFDAASAFTNNVGLLPTTSYVRGNYLLGDFTTAATIPVTPAQPYLISNVQVAP